MAQGIIAKFINIKAGSMGRSSSAQIGDSIDYITNSEKCDLKMSDVNVNQIGRELRYVTNDVKTLEGLYIGSRNVSDISNATNEMMQVKEFYNKVDGRVALHGIISLNSEESDPKNAGKLMLLLDELMQEVFPENQVVYAVHTNTDNLHIHFVANTVGLDGKKIHMDKGFMRNKFEVVLNRLALKYGFTPNEEWTKERKKDAKAFVERKMQLRLIVDKCIEDADDFNSFVNQLRDQGLTVNVGTYLSLKLPGMTKAIRSKQLGAGYTIDAIMERMLTKRDEFEEYHLGNHAMNISKRDVVNYIPKSMKKYADMTDEEKKKAIRLLRMNRNPWKESFETNWMIRKAADELSDQMHMYDILDYFAPTTHRTKDAKEEIVKRQKLLGEEKKEIKNLLKKYKPVIALYEEMKKYEIRAYLYDYADKTEYLPDYVQYKELSERLMKGYSKTVDQVAGMLDELNNQLLYAKAQSEELSRQYKSINRYEKLEQIRKHEVRTEWSLFDAIGHSDAKKRAKEYGIYTTRLVYITAEDSDYRIRVMTTPDIVDGKEMVTTTVTVLDSKKTVVEEFSSNNIDAKEFNQMIAMAKESYGFDTCHIHKEEQKSGKNNERKNSR
ncbi:MAG: relaxase/mobilization nuclease domain-containing protein [Lachnospira sp.]|nr:relaxase/mobilization nuclease domain-containing protein [Lachnospira sp.]